MVSAAVDFAPLGQYILSWQLSTKKLGHYIASFVEKVNTHVI